MPPIDPDAQRDAMAKKNRKEQNMSDETNTEVGTEVSTEVVTENAVATVATTTASAEAEAPKTDERFKLLTLKDGTQVKRKDYILRRWAEKASRSDIAKELTELSGKKVPYQIVFAATKNVAGGPDKEAPAAAAAAEPAQNTEAPVAAE